VAVPVFSLAGVSVVRDGRPALTNVSWEVYADQRWVVLGSNGAGKTTLLQLAATSLAPTSGVVSLLGYDLASAAADLDELAPSVGVASAAVADLISGSASVLDVVVTGAWAALSRGPGDFYEARDDARALRLLGQLGCRAFAERTFGSLSEGERKRVQIARSLMPNPELLLLDEPAAGLDLGGREALLARLRRLALAGDSPALVMVTHHVEEIPLGFTHALLLRSGRVVSAGPLASTLTASSLSRTFGFPVALTELDGRYSARAA